LTYYEQESSICTTKCISHFHSTIFFLIGFIEHELYLGCILFIKSFTIIDWTRTEYSYVLFLWLTHLLQHYHDDFINKIFGCLHVGLNGSCVLRTCPWWTWLSYMGLGCQDKLDLLRDSACSLSPCAPRISIFGYIQIPTTIHHPESPPPWFKVRICDGGVAS
jgi:hypothetical protein